MHDPLLRCIRPHLPIPHLTHLSLSNLLTWTLRPPPSAHITHLPALADWLYETPLSDDSHSPCFRHLTRALNPLLSKSQITSLHI
jgi:hypothetical protein